MEKELEKRIKEIATKKQQMDTVIEEIMRKSKSAQTKESSRAPPAECPNCIELKRKLASAENSRDKYLEEFIALHRTFLKRIQSIPDPAIVPVSKLIINHAAGNDSFNEGPNFGNSESDESTSSIRRDEGDGQNKLFDEDKSK